jgi:hypothetical protein
MGVATGALMGAAGGSVVPGVGTVAGLAGGALVGGLTDILGGNQAAKAQRAAQGRARNDLTQGYGEAKGYQQPVYDTSLKNYTDLSGKYGSGGFDNPHMDAFKFDPQSVFQDPEYQAQMKAGTDAITRSAEAKGDMYSGGLDRDLTKFGQDTFAGRSDALYNRGFNATNTAFNQNAQSNLTNFNEGQQLTQPLTGATNQLTSLATGEGQDLANNDLGTGAIRANNINRTTTDLSGLSGDLAGLISNPQAKMGQIFAPKSGMK